MKSIVTTCDIRPNVRGDHNAIFLQILTGKTERGPGYWKLNSQILEDDNYKNQIRGIIQSVEIFEITYSEKWELIKIKCREFTQTYCAKKKN